MKAAAALALVLLVAEASARSADVPVPRYAGDLTIKKIGYTDSSTTDICLDDSEPQTFPKETTIHLFMTIDEVMTDHTVQLVDAVVCASFDAAMPSDGQEVEYVVAYVEADDSKEDAAKFTFQALTAGDGDTFNCDDTKFKRTPVGTGDCKAENESPAGSGYCYALDTTAPMEEQEGCTTPKDGEGNDEDFQYCQPSAGSGTQIDTSGDEATVGSLSYVSKAIILQDDYATDDVAVVLDSDGTVDPQFVMITDPNSIIIGKTMEKFTPSTNTYTTCVVVKGANSDPDTVTPPGTITDLDVRGLLTEENNGVKYYEFGFQQTPQGANDDKKYNAKTGTAPNVNAVTVNCEKLEPTARCFGYLQQDDDTVPLTISFEDNSNTIEVDQASLTWP